LRREERLCDERRSSGKSCRGPRREERLCDAKSGSATSGAAPGQSCRGPRREERLCDARSGSATNGAAPERVAEVCNAKSGSANRSPRSSLRRAAAWPRGAREKIERRRFRAAEQAPRRAELLRESIAARFASKSRLVDARTTGKIRNATFSRRRAASRRAEQEKKSKAEVFAPKSSSVDARTTGKIQNATFSRRRAASRPGGAGKEIQGRGLRAEEQVRRHVERAKNSIDLLFSAADLGNSSRTRAFRGGARERFAERLRESGAAILLHGGVEEFKELPFDTKTGALGRRASAKLPCNINLLGRVVGQGGVSCATTFAAPVPFAVSPPRSDGLGHRDVDGAVRARRARSRRACVDEEAAGTGRKAARR
jgi:hypothetical protein